MDDLLNLFRSNFKNLSGTPDELYKNFDKVFMHLSDNIKNMPELKDYADAYDKYGSDLYKSLKEEVKEKSESYLAKQTEIKRQEARRERRHRTFELEDGSKVKQYLDDNGNIRAQRKTMPDGTREVRRQHTSNTIKKDPKAANMSKVVSTYDGKTTKISRRPDARNIETKIINHETEEVYKEHQRRATDWGGGVTETHRDYTSIEEERAIHNDKMNQKYKFDTAEENIDRHASQADNTVPEQTNSIDTSNNGPDIDGNIPDVDGEVPINNQTTVDPPQVDPNNPLTWSDDDILNMSNGDYDKMNELMQQRDIAVIADKFKNIDPNRPATWTEEYINHRGQTPEEIADLKSQMDIAKNKDIVNQINQQRNAEDIPLNREQRRQQQKDNRNKGNQQKPKTKKQKKKDKKQEKFEDRNKAMGRDPEEVKRINKESNEQRQTNNKQKKEQQRQQAEKAAADKARGEEAYKKAMDEINSKSTMDRLNFYNMSEAERAILFEQENKLNKEIAETIKGQMNPDNANAYSYNLDLDELNKQIDIANENLKNGYKDPEWYKGGVDQQTVSDYIDDVNAKTEQAKKYRGENFKNIEKGIEGNEFNGEYTANKNYVDKDGNVIKNSRRVVKGGLDDVAKFGAVDLVMSGVNILGAIGDYKTARREGHGVVSSAVKAGVNFAIGEALGVWALPIELVKHVPGAVMKGADMIYKEGRRMNSAANFQTFGDAQFMDTQQLATMRQSGMEMAKMAQYNLQQTLMGNEATYLHR